MNWHTLPSSGLLLRINVPRPTQSGLAFYQSSQVITEGTDCPELILHSEQGHAAYSCPGPDPLSLELD